MFKLISKIITALIFWGVWIFAIFYIPYPESLTQGNFIQFISFFLSLFLAVVLTVNFFLKNLFISSSIAIGFIFLLILKALDSLNLVTLSLSIIAVGLLISYFKKIPSTSSGFKNLTKVPKIPKLTNLRKKRR